MESRENNSLYKEKLMITSLCNIRKIPKDMNLENTPKKIIENTPVKVTENEIKNRNGTSTIMNNSSFSFPKITYTSINQRNNYNRLQTNYSNYKKHKRPKIEISLKKMDLFIHPINRSVLEINRLIEIKENLVKKRFNELHKYKLQINPNNYYRNYGLNKYIEITNNNSKINNSLDYQFNNVSSYNNILLKEEENKLNTARDKKKSYKNIAINKYKDCSNLLRGVPPRMKNKYDSDYILTSFNEENGLVNTNSLWRGKNINDIIDNKTNLNFFKHFNKNSKNIGKLKAIE